MTRYHLDRTAGGLDMDRDALASYLRGYLQGDRARIAAALRQIDRTGEVDLGNVTITRPLEHAP